MGSRLAALYLPSYAFYCVAQRKGCFYLGSLLCKYGAGVFPVLAHLGFSVQERDDTFCGTKVFEKKQ